MVCYIMRAFVDSGAMLSESPAHALQSRADGRGVRSDE
jgi:hypothetical protein